MPARQRSLVRGIRLALLEHEEEIVCERAGDGPSVPTSIRDARVENTDMLDERLAAGALKERAAVVASTWETLIGFVPNAFVRRILPGLEPERGRVRR